MLVAVPAGEFQMGARRDDVRAATNEKPYRKVKVEAFEISKYEVTNAQYARFVAATSYKSGRDNRWKQFADLGGPRCPVVHISWVDAEAYCKWAGLRLPTEQEWERAARGVDGRIFPWGDKDDQALAVMQRAGPLPVGSSPKGISPTGCLDMAGNVWEWTSSNYDSDKKVVRGGGWHNMKGAGVRCSIRGKALSQATYSDIGFRCARNPSQKQ